MRLYRIAVNIQPVEKTGATTTRPHCTTGAGKSNEENCRKCDGTGCSAFEADGEAKECERGLIGKGLARVQRDRNVNERSANRKPHTYLPRKCLCLSFMSGAY